jgi:hypothetical protein
MLFWFAVSESKQNLIFKNRGTSPAVLSNNPSVHI